jgi:hypothetical protein
MTPTSSPTGSVTDRLRSGRTPLVLGAGALLLLGAWYATGSFVLALLVVVLMGGTAGALVVGSAWLRPRPEGVLPDVAATTDLAAAPRAGAGLRRVLRGVLSRPWVRGDGLVRAASTKLASEDALVWTPRGQRVAAPHLWVEWNVADAAEIADRWPLEALARELVEGYVEQTRAAGVRRLADRTWVHVLGRDDVPLGRVVVTAAFSPPQDAPLAAACAPSTSAPLPARRSPGPASGGRSVGHDAGGRGTGPGPAPAAGDGAGGVGGAAPVLAAARRVPARLRTLVAERVARPAPASPVPAPPASPRAVLVARAPGVGDVELRGTVRLGRDPRGGVVVDHPGVSWRHLVITPSGTGWTVTDEGSTNGTYLDGRRLSGPAALRAGAVLALGRDGPRWRLDVAPPAGEVTGALTTTAVGGRDLERTRREHA